MFCWLNSVDELFNFFRIFSAKVYSLSYFEGLLKTVSSETYAVCLIPQAVEKNPTFHAIMSIYIQKKNWKMLRNTV